MVISVAILKALIGFVSTGVIASSVAVSLAREYIVETSSTPLEKLTKKDCYTFSSTVHNEEEKTSPLLLFCSSRDDQGNGTEIYYWDWKDSKAAVNLKSQIGKGDILVTLEGESAPKTIFVEDDDHITNKQENISLSECAINTQDENVDGKRIALSCKDGVSSKNVFWLEKFDFLNQAKSKE